MLCVKKGMIRIIRIIGIVSLFLLTAFSYVYSFSGIHITNHTGATDYKWQPKQYKAIMTEGHNWIRMDEDGFNNAYPKKTEIDILLMGSSHMEAAEVGTKKNTGYRLNELLESYYTYNIGISDHTLYHCINNIEAAVDIYNPSKYVIIETDRVELNEQDIGKVISGEYPHIPSYDSGLLYWVQKNVPSMKNIYKQLEDWEKAGPSSNNVIENSEETKLKDDTQISDGYQKLLGDFLAQASTSVQKSGAQLIIFYQPATVIDKNGNYIDSTNLKYLDIFSKKCEEQGIIFVDMTEEFKELYDKEKVLAHGFNNTAVGVGHLNASGHKVIAEKLASVIQQQQEGKDVTQ